MFTNLPEGDILKANASMGDSVLNRCEKMQAGLDRRGSTGSPHHPGARVLDVGCGNGVPIDAFRRSGCSAEGFDPSDCARTAAKRKGLVLHESLAEDPMNYRLMFVVKRGGVVVE